MSQDCTELFLKYREIARLVWNVGYWPEPKLREWDCVETYLEAMARLFEGMILLALGYEGRVENKYSPGDAADFRVTAVKAETRLLVDRNQADDPGHQWGHPELILGRDASSYQLRFLKFFEWDVLGIRDFRLMEVLIQRLDGRDDLVGRHALLEVASCSISLVVNRES